MARVTRRGSFASGRNCKFGDTADVALDYADAFTDNQLCPNCQPFHFFSVCLAETRTEIFNEPVEEFFFKKIKLKVETPALQRA